MSYPGGRGGLQEDQGPEEKRAAAPVLPEPGTRLYIGTMGLNDQWYYWPDTPRGRDAVTGWLGTQGAALHRRVFRVTVDEVDEMTVTLPVGPQLTEK